MTFRIIQGDNRTVLKTIADNSIDAIVTDPPYGIDFLGKEWDANTGALETYQECLRVLKPGGHILAFSAARTYHHLAITLEQAGFEIRDQIMWIYSSGFPKAQKVKGFPGWKNGGLKPAHEPIALARKPSKLTVEKNMREWGTGAINIDATRIERQDSEARFPSNVLGEIPDYQKYFYCPKVSRRERHIGFDTSTIPTNPSGMLDKNANGVLETYQSRQQDGTLDKGNNHPTVKPVALMEYLIKLITPVGGIVLDPFNGSGTTGMAATGLGFEYIGIELDPVYVKIAETRITAWKSKDLAKNAYDDLFTE